MSESSRRDFAKSITGLGVAAVEVARTLAAQPAAAPRSKPNLVFVCSDQHGYKYTGYARHPIARTPNLDLIAQEGVVFESAYCSHPVCTPSRAGMMTGRFASDCNSFCNSTVWDGRHPIWATHLREEGYYCRAMGKMDLNDDFDTGFEEIQTSHGHRHQPDITSLFRRPVAFRGGERKIVDGGPRRNRSEDASLLELALGFLQTEAGKLQKPWAVYVGFGMPHPAFSALEEYYNLYPTENMDMPNIPPGHLESLHPVFQELRHFKGIATPIAEDRIRRARAGYYGKISELDEYVGKIYDCLRQTGQLENTLFVYTSDHGESLGEHGLWLKNNLYYVAARVPLILAGAGLPKSMTVKTPVAHVDVAATILDMAGSKGATGLRGHSLVPLMRGEAGGHPGFAFSECHSEGNCTGSFMIRKGDWKYLHFTWYDDLLFNVARDPGEFHNLIRDPETAQVRSELKDILHSLLNPEETTLRAFHAQEKMLAEMAGRMTEDELFNQLKGRLGPGQSRALAAKYKGR